MRIRTHCRGPKRDGCCRIWSWMPSEAYGAGRDRRRSRRPVSRRRPSSPTVRAQRRWPSRSRRRPSRSGRGSSRWAVYRGGWYSWDLLDNAGRPSAYEIHPEWQDLALGDYIKYWTRSGPVVAWEVERTRPNRFLGLRGLTDLRGATSTPASHGHPRTSRVSGGFRLTELPGGRARLVIGGYQVLRPRWIERLVVPWLYIPWSDHADPIFGGAQAEHPTAMLLSSYRRDWSNGVLARTSRSDRLRKCRNEHDHDRRRPAPAAPERAYRPAARPRRRGARGRPRRSLRARRGRLSRDRGRRPRGALVVARL